MTVVEKRLGHRLAGSAVIVAPPPSRNAVGGGKQTVYGVGLNWYPNTNLRFMFVSYTETSTRSSLPAAGGGIAGTPLGTPVGGEFDALVIRIQFTF